MNIFALLLFTIHQIIDQVSMKCGANEKIYEQPVCVASVLDIFSLLTVELNLMKFYGCCCWKWNIKK